MGEDEEMTRPADIAQHIRDLEAALAQAREELAHALEVERAKGRTVRDLAAETGLSHQRVHQLTS